MMLVWQPGAPSPTPTKSTTPTPCSSNTTFSAACRPAQSCSATRSRCCPAERRLFRPSSKPSQARTNSINLEYFILADVQSGGVHLSDVLLDRLRAGVKVNMIYDAFGSRDTPRHLLRCHAAGRSESRRVTIRSTRSPSGSAGRRTTATIARSPSSTAGSASPAASTWTSPTKTRPAPASRRRQYPQCLLARYRGAHRRPGRGRTAEAVLRHLARAEGARR